MFNLVIFGAPGSGKGTQSDLLIEEYGLFHISTGEVLRDQISRGTELGKIADSFISGGNLIPDELMINILAKTLDDNSEKAANGVIFDGFPRTIAQAEALKGMLAERGTQLNVVIGLEVYHNQTSPLRDFYINEGLYAQIKGSGTIEGIFADIKAAVAAKK